MSEFLNSVKDDLLDVRLRLAVLVLALGFVAAMAFAVLGGGSSSVATPGTTAQVAPTAGGIAISQTTSNASEPVTETTGGGAHQRGGSLRDPFTPLAGSAAKSAASSPAASKTTTPSSAATGGTSGSSTPSASTTPVATTKPSTPAKPKVTNTFKVTAQFGVLPAPSIVGAAAEPAQLKTYSDMALDEPLPDKSNAQLVFSGAVKRTKLEAVFTITGESILHGNASCLPSSTQCQAIRLQVGQSETLESIEADGSPVTYELRLVAIEKITKTVSTASAARARAASLKHESKAGRELLQSKGLTLVSGLEYSPSEGVLVPARRLASGASAHAAARRPPDGA
jgi:hypothetical protein